MTKPHRIRLPERLEDRLLMAHGHGMLRSAMDGPASAATIEVIESRHDYHDDDHHHHDDGQDHHEVTRQKLHLPGTPSDTIAFSAHFDGVQFAVEATRSGQSPKSPSILIQQDDGSFQPFKPGPSRLFRGSVLNRPDANVSVLLLEHGIYAEAWENGELIWQVEPELDASGLPTGMHWVGRLPDDHELHDDHFEGGVTKREVSPPDAIETLLPAELRDRTKITAAKPNNVSVFSSTDSVQDAVVLNPVTVKQAVIGFDVTHQTLQDGYGGNVQSLYDNIEFLLNSSTEGTLGTIWLRDALVDYVLGTVIVRASAGADPYRAAGNDAATIEALEQARSRWNDNLDSSLLPPEAVPQSDHDLVQLMTRSAGSAAGWAYVGTVNEFSRYSVTRGGDPNFWRGVSKHEIGHNWGLVHSHGRPEIQPNGLQTGLMWDPSPHDRLNPDETVTVLAERDSSGLTDIGAFTEHNVRPHARRDDYRLFGPGPFVLDVLDNDYDANNDPLYIHRLENHSTTSHPTDAGGTVTIIHGAGDRGQDVLRYEPPASFTGTDHFFYFAGEDIASQPKTAWAYVELVVESAEITVDTSLDQFIYDPGTTSSPVFAGATRVTPQTFGDVTWDQVVTAMDRVGTGQNHFNRDFVQGTVPTTFRHKLGLGTWHVKVNMSDPSADLNNQYLLAEDDMIAADIDRPRGENGTIGFDVFVEDGFLDLTFGDADSANPRWAVNRIAIERVGEPPTEVDLAADAYTYDFGTADSPVFATANPPAVRVSPETWGDIYWSDPVDAVDRPNYGLNHFNRDNVFGSNDATWSHQIAPGMWRVIFNMSDPERDFDNMFIAAEGLVRMDGIDRPAGENQTLAFEVYVEDGFLDLTFGDADPTDKAWALNRVALSRIGSPPIFVDLSQNQYTYDPGTENSPVFVGAEPVTPDHRFGEVTWTSNVSAADRGPGADGNHNAYNRDHVSGTSPGTFSHRIANGTWRVVYNLFDPDVAMDNLFVRAEGNTVHEGLDRPLGQNPTLSFEVAVNDGELNLTFGDADATERYWAVTRIALARVGAPPSPNVESVEIERGTPQRSIVSQLVVQFDNEVILPESAISVVHLESGQTLENVQVQSSTLAGKTNALITFGDGDHVEPRAGGNSLSDGNYRLMLAADQITTIGPGVPLDQDFHFGDQAADGFFRLYGDTDGDRDSDGQDYGRFTRAFLSTAGDSEYRFDLDFDGDGDVDGNEYGQFGIRFLTTV